MSKIMFDRKISRVNAYIKERYKKGYKIPIISDTMFHTMINNKYRIKYPAYFISLVLKRNYEEVLNNLVLSKNKLDKIKYKEKGKTVDFVCTLKDEIINIEMNNNSTVEELERNIEYALKLYGSKNEIGKVYEYTKVVQININNFKFEGNNKVIENYMLMNEEKEVMTSKLTIIQIYLPNIREKMYNEDKLNELEKFLLVLNENSSLSKDLSKGFDVMEEYIKDAIDASDDEKVLGMYDKEEHEEKVRLTRLRAAKREGLERGMKQGIEKGMEKGIAKGIEKGANDKQMEIAKNMFDKGIDIEMILECTGLSKEDIKIFK